MASSSRYRIVLNLSRSLLTKGLRDGNLFAGMFFVCKIAGWDGVVIFFDILMIFMRKSLVA